MRHNWQITWHTERFTQHCSSGNADCPYDFVVSGDLATNLLSEDYVLAVEMHNYTAISPDVSFGVALQTTNEPVLLPRLDLKSANGLITLSWAGPGFFLQQANWLTGSWANVPGPITNSPYSSTASSAAQYFRLRKRDPEKRAGRQVVYRARHLATIFEPSRVQVFEVVLTNIVVWMFGWVDLQTTFSIG